MKELLKQTTERQEKCTQKSVRTIAVQHNKASRRDRHAWSKTRPQRSTDVHCNGLAQSPMGSRALTLRSYEFLDTGIDKMDFQSQIKSHENLNDTASV